MSFYGENIKLDIFGHSHDSEIGVRIEGLPGGLYIDTEELQCFMQRRSPGRSQLSSARKEPDIPEFISGLKDGCTCGESLTAIIKNKDIRPGDYEKFKNIPRPGHADLTAALKYGENLPSGGGAFSGRMTAPLCIAGGIMKQLLRSEGIEIISRVYAIGDIKDGGELRQELSSKPFPVNDEAQGRKMQELILKCRAEGDSVGGIAECAVLNLPAGLGGPLFEGMEGRIAACAFAIPAVKGIDFGAGVDCSHMLGSENNDEYALKDGKPVTLTNNCGGILGGITNSMPLVFRLYIKPTPSIAKKQRSIDLSKMTEAEISVTGRHDPCIVPRALPCAEAAAAIAVYDALISRRKELSHGFKSSQG